MTRKRRVLRLLGAALLPVVMLTVFFSSSPAQAVNRADLDDFSFDSYHADFELGRDASGRSTLHTTERFDARFPDFDQNRGFIRSIPIVYNGFSLDIIDLSVTDETGADRPFDYEYAGDFVDIIMAVPAGEFVRGEQTYVLRYTQQDVTAHFADTHADEFYWDLNGTDSRQPFGRVSATLTLGDGIDAALNGDAACYRGALGSETACSITQTNQGVFEVHETGLGPGENVSIAVGFEPGTFAQAPESNRLSDEHLESSTSMQFLRPPAFLHDAFGGLPVFLWGGTASIAASATLFIRRFIRKKPKTGRAIVAQYDPPRGVSAALSAAIVKADKKAMTGTILDLAVRRHLRILHDAPSNMYGIQSISSEGLLSSEKRVYDSIFSEGAPAGKVYWLNRKTTRFGDAAARLKGQTLTEGRAAGLFGKTSGWSIVGALLLLLTAVAFFAIQGLASFGFPLFIAVSVIGFIALIWSLIASVILLGFTRPPLTYDGALLHNHLLGLREFIRLAEADRIRMLQSVSGAEVDENRIVQVYERLLPYAVIFGFENEWQQELAKYYRESMPDWASGGPSFSQAIHLGALNHSIVSSPVTPTTSSGGGFSSGGSFSSSSGGSSGGGFSGGGGGGGGSRGI